MNLPRIHGVYHPVGSAIKSRIPACLAGFLTTSFAQRSTAIAISKRVIDGSPTKPYGLRRGYRGVSACLASPDTVTSARPAKKGLKCGRVPRAKYGWRSRPAASMINRDYRAHEHLRNTRSSHRGIGGSLLILCILGINTDTVLPGRVAGAGSEPTPGCPKLQDYSAITFSACGPFWPWVTSIVTF